MRLLHTSDWHVGRTFHGRDLLADQEAVLGHLAGLVADERIDVVVVSGDLYDRAVPSAEAVAACTRALSGIRRAGAELVIISGNHDSAQRLGAFGEFAAAGGLHLRTSIAELDQPVLLADASGPVAFYGIPYLEPDPARHALGMPQLRGHAGVLTEAMGRIRVDLAQRGPGVRSVVLVHAFVTGGAASESERTIAVGGIEDVPAAVFDGVDYVALGHLHGAQTLAEHLRYAGSPIAYSFSEATHRKSVWLVELGPAGLHTVERRELPVPRRLATVRGELAAVLSDPAAEELTDRYLHAVLTDPVRPLDAMRRLQERFPFAVRLDWQPDGGQDRPAPRYASAGHGRDDTQLAGDFVLDCRGSVPNPAERELLSEAFEAVRKAEAQR
ncbi:MAG TPA: exonuclease SbcCD subunit D [Pseudonocardiaceae bacterium]|jgi:exonuclease SbcD|nr:exonuclease SbcCD subunit D [Pseudonocardiaceae bacterium]